jgi:ketosteroid isomerase-like protein
LTIDNVAGVRNAYQIAERKGLEAWIDAFSPDGVFTDSSVGISYRSREVADVVQNYATAFSNMRRELYHIYADDNVVVVQLALQGTHDGPLQLPFGVLRATGKQMDAPCCDVFEIEDGKIKRFDCYPEGSVIFAQLGYSPTSRPHSPADTGRSWVADPNCWIRPSVDRGRRHTRREHPCGLVQRPTEVQVAATH